MEDFTEAQFHSGREVLRRKHRRWRLISYVPGLVLLAAGVTMLLTTTVSSTLCDAAAPQIAGGGCGTVYTVNPLGPILFFGAGVYVITTFGFWWWGRGVLLPHPRDPRRRDTF